MKNTSCLEYRPKASTLEVREKDILDWNKPECMASFRRQNHKYPYPRHISQLESLSHRGYSNGISSVSSLPQTCALKTASEKQEVNLAVEILKYQLSDREAKQAHLNSVRRNLQRRLQVAKNNGNNRLVNLLQQEYQELQLP